jgi:hypothetical protein
MPGFCPDIHLLPLLWRSLSKVSSDADRILDPLRPATLFARIIEVIYRLAETVHRDVGRGEEVDRPVELDIVNR